MEEDKVTWVVTLPEEVREDRDDMGHFLIYDEKFVRRDGDEQPQVHAFCVAEPRWADDRFRVVMVTARGRLGRFRLRRLSSASGPPAQFIVGLRLSGMCGK